MTLGTDETRLRRYLKSQVTEALAQVQRGGHVEAHSAIVLASEVRALDKQLTELRAAAAALVEHIERHYYNLVAPSDVARKLHAELGSLASHVFNVLERLEP